MITKYSKGFTLVETLVAISILMIAIAGPLTVANKGYTAAMATREQTVAMNLAQEGMEWINNVKDNRLWGNWEPGTDFRIKTGVICADGEGGNFCTFNANLPIVGAADNGAANGFFYFDMVPGNVDQVVATVVVEYRNGSVIDRIILRQVLSNYHR